MRPRKMISKKQSKCRQCGKPIEPGQQIFWARGEGAWHVDCETAQLQATVCTSCQGKGRRWNNAPCLACDGTGSRDVQEFAKKGGHPRKDNSSAEDACCGDLAYEDACSRACGM
jgi:hypothetical protein